MSISYAVFCLTRRPPRSPLFPYTTLFRSSPVTRRAFLRRAGAAAALAALGAPAEAAPPAKTRLVAFIANSLSDSVTLADGQTLEPFGTLRRSEEHTSELQSHVNLVCRLLLDAAPPEISTLSLHDALPIFPRHPPGVLTAGRSSRGPRRAWGAGRGRAAGEDPARGLHREQPQRQRDPRRRSDAGAVRDAAQIGRAHV